MTDPQTPDVAAERPPYLLAGLVALGALVLYVLTLAPTTQFWDASEYITAAHALGIPHPPGSPLFVILAHAWGLIPPYQSLRGSDERSRSGPMVSHRRALVAADRGDRRAAAPRRGRGRRGRGHDVHRMEPVGGE